MKIYKMFSNVRSYASKEVRNGSVRALPAWKCFLWIFCNSELSVAAAAPAVSSKCDGAGSESELGSRQLLHTPHHVSSPCCSSPGLQYHWGWGWLEQSLSFLGSELVLSVEWYFHMGSQVHHAYWLHNSDSCSNRPKLSFHFWRKFHRESCIIAVVHILFRCHHVNWSKFSSRPTKETPPSRCFNLDNE